MGSVNSVVTSDFHVRKYRMEDTISSMGQILKYVIKNEVGKVYFLGDAYNSRYATPYERRVFQTWVKRLIDKGIRVMILPGNHDTVGDLNNLLEFKTLGVKNVKIVGAPYIEDDIYFNHMLLNEAAIGADDRLLSTFHVSTSVAELIEHNPEIKMFFLGHIHKPQVLNEKPFVAYCGSIERVTFGEVLDKKGFYHIKNGKPIFVELKVRPMLIYKIGFPKQGEWDASGVGDKGENPLVKVNIKGTPEQVSWFSEEDFAKTVEDAYEIKYEYEIIKNRPRRAKEIKESISPLKGLENYLDGRDLDKSTRKEVLKKGKEIIDGLS